jgi:hypothetical protein
MKCYIKPEIQRLINRYLNKAILLTYEEYSSLRMNSYERAALYPIMDNNCFIKVCLQYQQHFSLSANPPSTYEEAALQLLFPLLIERLERETTGNDLLVQELQKKRIRGFNE